MMHPVTAPAAAVEAPVFIPLSPALKRHLHPQKHGSATMGYAYPPARCSTICVRLSPSHSYHVGTGRPFASNAQAGAAHVSRSPVAASAHGVSTLAAAAPPTALVG